MASAVIDREIKGLRFSGPQVTWAGEFPWKKALCFGMEDGSIIVRDFEGKPIWRAGPSHSLEAINGVAFTPNLMAVSTRSEVLVTEYSSTGDPLGSLVVPHGAHGVVATRRGGFMAPMGAEGILQVEKVAHGLFRKGQSRPIDEDVYFYKMASVGSTEQGGELFACAGRTSGLLTLSVDAEGKVESLLITKGGGPDGERAIDVVDVCPLSTAEHPFAVVALGIDNTLYYCSDVRNERPSLGLRLPELRGTGYSLLGAQGYLFVLTSEELCILPELGTRLLQGALREGRIAVIHRPVEAMDCSIAYGEHLLLVDDQSVHMIEISMISSLKSQDETTADFLYPTWEFPRTRIMIEAQNRKPIRVLSGGKAGPYIKARVDLLEQVRERLDRSGVSYWVEPDVISIDGGPGTVWINLGLKGDAVRVQALLDDVE